MIRLPNKRESKMMDALTDKQCKELAKQSGGLTGVFYELLPHRYKARILERMGLMNGEG